MNESAAGVIKHPGPDHPITITKNGKHVRVTFAGRVIADSTHALTLTEASYKPVVYVPRSDADMSALRPTDHRTHCPYKGDASYFSIDGFLSEPRGQDRRELTVRLVQSWCLEEFRAIG